MATSEPAGHDQWAKELTAIARAVTGGMLVGVPVLYTMEVWWTGQRTTPERNLIVLAVCLALLVVVHHTAGFRSSPDAHLGDAMIDAVVALGVGLVSVTAVLVLLRQLTLDTPLGVATGKIVYQAIPFALGAGIVRQVLNDRGGADDDPGSDRLHATVADVGVSVLGTLVVSVAIAPTDEIPMIATAVEGAWVIALLAASLVISYAVVFVAGFSGQEQRRTQHGWLQHPTTETVVCYLASLATAYALLWMFHRAGGSFTEQLTHAVILGLPASIGGAAGRLAL